MSQKASQQRKTEGSHKISIVPVNCTQREMGNHAIWWHLYLASTRLFLPTYPNRKVTWRQKIFNWISLMTSSLHLNSTDSWFWQDIECKLLLINFKHHCLHSNPRIWSPSICRYNRFHVFSPFSQSKVLANLYIHWRRQGI